MEAVFLHLWLSVFAQTSYIEEGRLSIYHPDDGSGDEVACGLPFTWSSVHIAHRNWRRLGCGRRVLVCAVRTRRCVLARVLDAGPWGIYSGALRRCKEEGRWRRWTQSLRPPRGWQWRGVTDLSYALWARLGKPKFLSTVRLYFLEKEVRMPKVAGTPKAGKGKTAIQTLIFSKSSFASAAAAKKWAKSHGYKSGGIDETGSSYRIRQFNPEGFKKGSFKTITLTSGVKAVVGRPKKEKKMKSAEVELATTLLQLTEALRRGLRG